MSATATLLSRTGVDVHRRFTVAGEDPFSTVAWERRTARITSALGSAVFEQGDVEAPAAWSESAVNIVAARYFRGEPGSPERETSVRQLILRVVSTICDWSLRGGYFEGADGAAVFGDELAYLLLNQKAWFNSPVWFNLGARGGDGELLPQQASACFILSVSDDMASIMDLAKTEALVFKNGSGAGCNLSALRSSREEVSGGGKATGPVSFMVGLDRFATVVAAGGRTRRSAKMVVLDVDHPDIVDFVRCKAEEESRAWQMIDAGFDARFDVREGAYGRVHFQNANHSVRLSDAFLDAVIRDELWQTRAVTDGRVLMRRPAREILREMAQAAHRCGDPGVQYDSTIQRWNPVKESGRINATNPCSEFVFLDDTACNLASLNLMSFLGDDGKFHIADFTHAVDVMLLAMDVIAGFADYPTERIRERSVALRPLGLGYSNLGALLMSCGLPYDSEEGRRVCAAVTALMTGRAYYRSAQIAAHVGPFSEYPKNQRCFLDVIGQHAEQAEQLEEVDLFPGLRDAARRSWREALQLGEGVGFRNAQVSVLAPTGTISLVMGCDTMGIEPELALTKRKQLADGGELTLLNGAVASALERRGYEPNEAREILDHVAATGTVEGARAIRDCDLAVFDCAFEPANGSRSISPDAHLRMLAAAQPFLSGGISKTVNLPSSASVEDIERIFLQGWQLGLKSVCVYRDGCKRSQPLSDGAGPRSRGHGPGQLRRKLADVRQAITHKFSVAGHEGYLTVGLFEDGQPGEIFITMSKQGSTISGLMDTIAVTSSTALQYGVPLQVITRNFRNQRFDPQGFTGNPRIPAASSVIDYIANWLELTFLSDEQNGAPTRSVGVTASVSPPCANCGALMTPSGSCHTCTSCGESAGCG